MIIPQDTLFFHGATKHIYQPNEFIFHEGSKAKCYFQIVYGTVKINNFLENGKEFVHGFPYAGHCIGESYLFTDKPYAINAVAVSACEIIRLDKSVFIEMIMKDAENSFRISNYTAERLHFRYIISSLLSVTDPLIKLSILLDHLKKYFGVEKPFDFEVPYTRHQLATLTGLRVETVIRTFKKMEKVQLVKISNSKIYY